MSELDDFRRDTRAWLEQNAPASMRTPPKSSEELCWGGSKTKYPADVMKWLEVNAARGFTAPTWPKALGGGGSLRWRAPERRSA